jgi:hypothetical protein
MSIRGLFDCHPEQAFFAQRGIQASRAKCRVLCDTIIARLARFLTKLPLPVASGRPSRILCG